MLFANASLVRRIERAETGLMLAAAKAAARRLPPDQPVIVDANGGAFVFVEEGSPLNKMVGFGFGGTPAPELFDDVERRFFERGASVQAEVATLGDHDFVRTLSRRRYEVIGFENVLGLAITSDLVDALSRRATDVEVVEVGAEDVRTWMDVVTEGFLHPDTFDAPPSHESHGRETLERVFGDTIAASGFRRFLARRDGAVAGGASFRVEDGVAQLSGAATVPAHRRRGVQGAFLRHRLLEAARLGCDIAVVTTQPGSKSQENVQKAGFSVLYTRAIMIKSPAV